MAQDFGLEVRRELGGFPNMAPGLPYRAETLTWTIRAHVVRARVGNQQNGAQRCGQRDNRTIFFCLLSTSRVEVHEITVEVDLERLQIARGVVTATSAKPYHCIHPHVGCHRYRVEEAHELCALRYVRKGFAAGRQWDVRGARDLLFMPSAIQRRFADRHDAPNVSGAELLRLEPCGEFPQPCGAEIRHAVMSEKLLPELRAMARRRTTGDLRSVQRHIARDHDAHRHFRGLLVRDACRLENDVASLYFG
ncbi:MAG TPA: hypothetical protein VFB54_03715 [Burkholderiales bacterium]|nr:hypothetical protein [Burkholderiales bacterium]